MSNLSDKTKQEINALSLSFLQELITLATRDAGQRSDALLNIMSAFVNVSASLSGTAAGTLTANIPSAVGDVDLALEQWDAYICSSKSIFMDNFMGVLSEGRTYKRSVTNLATGENEEMSS